MQLVSYNTILKISRAEYSDKGSRFIAIIFPISNIEDFKLVLNDIKLEHPKAVHHCFAYRIGTDKNNFRSNDDGEPSGSAGKPILGQIHSYELSNVAIIVVRYFGGVLLGVPGLINAYKTSAKLAIESSKIVSVSIEENFLIETNYENVNTILQWVKRFSLKIISKELDFNCKIVIAIPIDKSELVIKELNREVKIIKL